MKLKKNKNPRSIEREFFRITGILPFHPSNVLNDRFIRKDKIFDRLAKKVFDHPGLLEFLIEKTKKWQKLPMNESTCALMGYIYYCKEDFKQAEKYFLKAIQMNPWNLDNWFDFAFSLYHQNKEKHKLAKGILFNFDWCVRFFSNQKINFKSLKRALKDAS